MRCKEITLIYARITKLAKKYIAQTKVALSEAATGVVLKESAFL